MKQRIVFVAGLLISIGCLWWVFSGINFGDMLDALGKFELIALVPSLFFFCFSMYLRAVRWGVLFRPRYELSGRQLFRPIMIGFAFNCIMPARAGEFMRALYVGKFERTGTPTALATIVTERIFDGLTLLVCLSAALSLLPRIDPALEVDVWGVSVRGSMIENNIPKIIWGSVALVAAVGCFLIPGFFSLVSRIIHAIPALSERSKKELESMVERIGHGFESVRAIRNLTAIIWYSVLIWLGVALSIWTLAFGFPGIPMDFTQAVAIMALIALFIIVPTAPGYWGLFEAGAVFALFAMDILDDRSIATAYAIVIHLVHFIPVVIIGLIFAAQSQLKTK